MSKPLAWINAITGDVTTVDCSDTLLWAPLYLAPPKREPLSDDELPTNNPKINTDGERLAFHAEIRWAEHQHGIRGR